MKHMLTTLFACSLCLLSCIQAADIQKGVIKWGVSIRQGKRNYLEDRYLAEKNHFGVFDGHGGDHTANYVAKQLPTIFEQAEGLNTTDKLRNTYLQLDNYARQDYLDGTTATTALINEKNIYIANCGDSRTVLALSNGTIDYQTCDHKPSSPEEQKRIKKAGGNVFFYTLKSGKQIHRVCRARCLACTYKRQHQKWDGISIARTIGDSQYEKNVLTAEPDITNVKRTSEQAFMILASDGLWDTVSSKQAIDIVANELKAEAIQLPQDSVTIDQKIEDGNDIKATLAARKLRDQAYVQGSRDNIAVLVALLNAMKPKKSISKEDIK